MDEVGEIPNHVSPSSLRLLGHNALFPSNFARHTLAILTLESGTILVDLWLERALERSCSVQRVEPTALRCLDYFNSQPLPKVNQAQWR
jgi:hypothetical protein